LKLDVEASTYSLKNPEAFWNHLFSDAVSGDDCNLVTLHLLNPRVFTNGQSDEKKPLPILRRGTRGILFAC
jgi:hypothetical protein